MSNPKWNRLGEEQRKAAINDLIYFFEKERDEKIGVIAAGQLLDFFLEYVGSEIYNKGVIDSKRTIEKRLEDLNYDLDDLLDAQ